MLVNYAKCSVKNVQLIMPHGSPQKTDLEPLLDYYLWI